MRDANNILMQIETAARDGLPVDVSDWLWDLSSCLPWSQPGRHECLVAVLNDHRFPTIAEMFKTRFNHDIRADFERAATDTGGDPCS